MSSLLPKLHSDTSGLSELTVGAFQGPLPLNWTIPAADQILYTGNNIQQAWRNTAGDRLPEYVFFDKGTLTRSLDVEHLYCPEIFFGELSTLAIHLIMTRGGVVLLADALWLHEIMPCRLIA